ncbi:hypothetical protein AKJ08_2712 [Vulgatibacter incomptus]|uniref:SprT-like domain-containing protein n=1 Tax=Vulgatibacter incomptus TaxID=1391653 RepID=A0A0K1PFM8_9BACT|nr:hypothetical protein AKJ08_2712 [Vulgatibacter incomptus]
MGRGAAAHSEKLERAAALADRLSTLLDERVRLTITDNTSTMISFRRSRSLVAIRVHQMFLDAPANVVQALADYASRRPSHAGQVIDDFVKRNESRVRRARVRRQAQGLDPFGRVHDLKEMFDKLNARYFAGRVDARIGWGREAPDRRRRSIKMGTYFHESRVIRIHPALDREEVPAYFVRFVIFHEMLHQAVPPQLIGGRRVAHSPEFRACESAYPDFERALAWERENLGLLLGRHGRRQRTFDPDDLLA